jgi:hypothetical protein
MLLLKAYNAPNFCYRILRAEQWLGLQLPIVNPPLWELGHMTWFTEFFCLREGNPNKGARITQGDFWYNSATMQHNKRWQQDYISQQETIDYCNKILAEVQEKIAAQGENKKLQYFF